MATIDALRDLIYVRDGGLCGICGNAVERPKMTLDHIEPRIRGGADSLDNLQLAHGPCNSRKRDGHPIAEGSCGLPKLRYAMRLTQAALSAKSGVSNKTIVSIEGGAWPRQSTIRKLASALGIPPPALARELRREQERER